MKTMRTIFTRRGLWAALVLGLLAVLAIYFAFKSEAAGEPRYIEDLKEVLTNQREFRFIEANSSSYSASDPADYNSVEHMSLLRDVRQQISSADLPEITPSKMTVLDMDLDGKVEVVLQLTPGHYGWLILHWEDGVVYGYYRWERNFDGYSLSEAGILVRGGIISYDPDVPGALEAARKEYYDHYYYYFEFNGPEYETFEIGFGENPYHAPTVVWSDFTPENIELLVTHKAAETALQYPSRDVLTQDGKEEKEEKE